MKKFLLITVLFFIMNNVGAYPYLNCNVDGEWEYAGPPTDGSELYQRMKIVAEYDGAFWLDGYYEGDNLVMNHVFPNREGAKGFCMAMKYECAKHFPNSSGVFKTYDTGWEELYPISVAYGSKENPTIKDCSALIPD